MRWPRVIHHIIRDWDIIDAVIAQREADKQRDARDAHYLGELLTPDDVASTDEWGHAHTDT